MNQIYFEAIFLDTMGKCPAQIKMCVCFLITYIRCRLIAFQQAPVTPP